MLHRLLQFDSAGLALEVEWNNSSRTYNGIIPDKFKMGKVPKVQVFIISHVTERYKGFISLLACEVECCISNITEKKITMLMP